jgi:hypothetical protein
MADEPILSPAMEEDSATAIEESLCKTLFLRCLLITTI